MNLLIVIIALAFVFDYINGFHDAANSIATVVSTKVLTPFQAVLWAALFNFIAYFIFKDHAVANTISKTVHQEFITLPVILSGLVAAILWNLLTWWYGIPSSSSHTLIGGFAGAAVAHAYMVSDRALALGDIVEKDKIVTTVAFIFLAPIVGMVISMFITLVTLVRQTWYRAALIALTATGTWLYFGHLEHAKLEENLGKYWHVEDLKQAAAQDPARTADLNAALQRMDRARPILNDFVVDGVPVAERLKAEVDPGIDAAKLGKDLGKAGNLYIRIGIAGISLLFILVYLYVEKMHTPNAFSMANMFKRLQLVTSAAFSIGHGGNDAQKVMGIITAALIANGTIADFKDMPWWVPLGCYTAMGLGTLSGGWKIVKTMGSRITKVTPLEGVCAESAGAMTLYLTEQMGIPVSTTHTITGSIIGVGATKRTSAVRWGVTLRLLWAWIITVPVSALVAAIVYWLWQLFGL